MQATAARAQVQATAIKDLPKEIGLKVRIREAQTAVPADSNPVGSGRTTAVHSNPEVVRSSPDPVLPKKAVRAITSPDQTITAVAIAIKAITKTVAKTEVPDGLKTETTNPVRSTGIIVEARTTKADSNTTSRRARKSITRRRKSSCAVI